MRWTWYDTLYSPKYVDTWADQRVGHHIAKPQAFIWSHLTTTSQVSFLVIDKHQHFQRPNGAKQTYSRLMHWIVSSLLVYSWQSNRQIWQWSVCFLWLCGNLCLSRQHWVRRMKKVKSGSIQAEGFGGFKPLQNRKKHLRTFIPILSIREKIKTCFFMFKGQIVKKTTFSFFLQFFLAY